MTNDKGLDPSKTQWLVDTARDVMIEGVRLGLDEAGTRLLGPTAWRGFKQVMSPVVRRLQQKFPALSFGKPEDKKAAAAASDAAEYLRRDTDLQRLLLENFGSLKEGQQEILARIVWLERLAEKSSRDVHGILQISKEILAELKEEQTVTSSTDLPTWVDVSDILDQYDLMMRVTARRKGLQTSDKSHYLILHCIGQVVFQSKVFEEGKTNTVYNCRVLDTTTFPTSEKYLGENPNPALRAKKNLAGVARAR